MTDEELIAQAQRHPAQIDACWEQLYVRHHQRVALWCLRFSNDRDRAADLTQEIFLKVRSALASFQGDAKFTTWLFTVCRNHCINQARRDFTPEPLPEFDTLTLSTGTPDPVEQFDRAGREQQARTWINTLLDPVEKQVFTLHYVEELPLNSVTRILGLTNASGAKAHIVSAKRKLAEAARRWRSRHEP